MAIDKKKLKEVGATAQNGLGSRDLFQRREAYRIAAYDDRVSGYPVQSFWNNEMSLYGRVDTDYYPCLCRDSSIITLEENVRAHTFVRDAYLDMKKEFEMQILKGKLSTDSPYFGDFKAQSGYSDTTYTILQYSNNIVAKINTHLNLRKDKRNNIKDFTSFLAETIEYFISLSDDLPVSLSGFITSKNFSILSTGLAFEIAENINYGDDVTKINDFIDFGCFEIYYNIAKKYGFYIDKNIPWRLIANINSVPMKSYMRKSDVFLTSPRQYFNYYTNSVHNLELNFISSIFSNAYRMYLAKYPKRAEKVGECMEVITLPTITTLNTSESTLWLSLFLRVKNNEFANLYTPKELENINKNAIQYSYMDTSRVEHIMSYFNGYGSIPGSANYGYVTQQFKNKKKPLDNFSEYVKLQVKKTNNRDY